MDAKVLVIGGGGREHALAWALSRSEKVSQVYVAPGNGGTAWANNLNSTGIEPCSASQNVPLKVDDFDGLVTFARENDIRLTVVGPEVPLANGIVDVFKTANLPIFGPSEAAAQLEGSKAFAKSFMEKHGIPTAKFGVFSNITAAEDFVRQFPNKVVVKADGLAAGKGVIICQNRDEAMTALQQIMKEDQFGEAGRLVVIEEQLVGKEFSVLAFSDGKIVKPMLVARDHKRILDGDQGLNTGGMGAFAPTPDITPEQIEDIRQRVLQPTIDGMRALGVPYVGVLYAGLMQTTDGMQVLEFNCRFGDPETQVILPLLETDLYDILLACVEGRLAEQDIRWKTGSCATVILASQGYPEDYPKGLPISGLEQVKGAIIFHAGTRHEDGQLVTDGGRVLSATALGETLEQALDKAYAEVEHIHFDGMHYRRDIGRTTKE